MSGAEGRPGRHAPSMYGEVTYDHARSCFMVRVDCKNNPEFWLQLTLTEKDLNAAKTQGDVLYGTGVTFGKREEEEDEE